MASIEVDFDVYKALTVRRETETVTYNDVLRDILGLRAEPPEALSVPKKGLGCTFKGVHFADGTQFRATYKGQTYAAEIAGSTWMDSDGNFYTSPSDAAKGVTHTNVNGWTFWEAKRPGDSRWCKLEALR